MAYWKNDEKDRTAKALTEALGIEGPFPEREAASRLSEEIRGAS